MRLPAPGWDDDECAGNCAHRGGAGLPIRWTAVRQWILKRGDDVARESVLVRTALMLGTELCGA